MTIDPRIVLYYLLLMSFLTFFLMGYDKHQARRNRWRIAEKTLWLFLLCGGGLGGWLGMMSFHHKNQKPLFRIGIPCCMVVQWGYLLYQFL
jgi:uncharacterized membrane protein YsdA (DUF1294 family)